MAKSPSQATQGAYEAANQGKYSEIESYMSSEALSAMKGDLGAMAGGVKGIWDKETHNGTITKIEILREEVRGEGAKVYFRLYFKDGTKKENSVPLIREKGHWRLTIE